MGQGQLISTEDHGLKVLKVYNENGRAVAFDVELSGDDVIVALNDMRTYQALDIKSVNIPWWKSTSQTTLRVPVGFTPEQVTFELFPFGLDLNAIATKTAGFSLAESKPIKVESAIGEDSNLIAEDKPLISMPAIASFGGGLTSSIKWLAVGAAAIGLLVYSPIIKNVASAALQAPKRQNPSSAKRNTKKAAKARSQQRMSNGRFK
jgi:hypothetical protein